MRNSWQSPLSVAGLFFVFVVFSCFAAEESITVTTYYPSPYGVYNEMQLYPHNDPVGSCSSSRDEGLMYYDLDEHTLKVCMCKNPPACSTYGWSPASGYWAPSPTNPDNIYNTNPGNVGIGTTDPQGLKLFVNANNGVRNGIQIADPRGHYLSIGGGIDTMGHNSAGFHVGTVGGPTPGGIGGGVGYDYTTNDMGIYSAYNIAISSNAASPPLGAGDIKFSTGGVERMRIMNSGNVGIGTTNPGASLHIVGSPTIVSDRTLLVLDGGGSRDAAVYLNAVGSDGVTANGIFESSAVGGHGGWTTEPEGIFLCAYKNNDINQKSRVRIIGNPITFEEGSVGIGAWNPTLGPLEMGSGAYCSAGGTWTDASSKTYKNDIAPLALDKALTALRGLNPVTFRYKRSPDEQSVGFIAEDVPELVATKDRTGLSPMDIVAVLTKVVQQQEREIKDLKQEVDRLKKRS